MSILCFSSESTFGKKNSRPFITITKINQKHIHIYVIRCFGKAMPGQQSLKVRDIARVFLIVQTVHRRNTPKAHYHGHNEKYDYTECLAVKRYFHLILLGIGLKGKSLLPPFRTKPMD